MFVQDARRKNEWLSVWEKNVLRPTHQYQAAAAAGVGRLGPKISSMSMYRNMCGKGGLCCASSSPYISHNAILFVSATLDTPTATNLSIQTVFFGVLHLTSRDYMVFTAMNLRPPQVLHLNKVQITWTAWHSGFWSWAGQKAIFLPSMYLLSKSSQHWW